MTFPTNTGTQPLTLSQTFIHIRAIAGSMKSNAVEMRDRSLAGNVSALDVMNYCTNLAGQRATITSLAATPGIVAYVVSFYPGVDLVAAYTSMIAQVDATIAWMVANFPKAPSGELLLVKFDSNGNTVISTFSSASLGTFRTQLDLLIAQID